MKALLADNEELAGKQLKEVSEVMCAINVAGGMCPAVAEASTQTDFQINVTLPWMFTEFDVPEGSLAATSNLAKLAGHVPLAKPKPEQPSTATASKLEKRHLKEEADLRKLIDSLSFEDSVRFFNNLLGLKARRDLADRKTNSDPVTLD